ncbi:MAG: sigma-70 family RNA polymerase sigma factor [Anaerolineales bacterium]|nr:sigma-70 family RNA polymerase sigma factor [Chloroflexota bacterium]MBL6980617.1 sigma-70 family RNA polymerase sigma factor [Anaerolineales bacterium]
MVPPQETTKLSAALAGDQHAFGQVVEPYRNELIAHCYRFTGSMQDAEDMVQETLLRAWRKRATYARRATFRAWLYKIATNACLDSLKKSSRRTLPSSKYPAANPDEPFAPPIHEPIWLEPIPDELLAEISTTPEARYSIQESITLAFTIALQTLPPRQRAVLLLRDVLGWRSRETAETLDISLSAANSALFRARQTLEKTGSFQRYRKPRETVDSLLEQYIKAWENADIDGLVSLIKEDASFVMPPSPSWYSGRDAIATAINNMLFTGDAGGRWRLRMTRANAQPAFGFYQRDESSGEFRAFGIQVLTFDGEEIATISHFLLPGLFQRFGLPEKISPRG